MAAKNARMRREGVRYCVVGELGSVFIFKFLEKWKKRWLAAKTRMQRIRLKCVSSILNVVKNVTKQNQKRIHSG